jgi:hypothetical protein
MTANVTITATYTTSDNTTIPIDLTSWAHRTQNEATVATIINAQVAQSLLEGKEPPEFDPTWDKWWTAFSTDANVKIITTKV